MKPSNLVWFQDLDLSNLVWYPTITSFWKEKLILKQKTHFSSLETRCIVLSGKFYLIYIRTSPGDRIPLNYDSLKYIQALSTPFDLFSILQSSLNYFQFLQRALIWSKVLSNFQHNMRLKWFLLQYLDRKIDEKIKFFFDSLFHIVIG